MQNFFRKKDHYNVLWEGSPNVYGDEGENGVSRAYQLDQHYLGELRELDSLGIACIANGEFI